MILSSCASPEYFRISWLRLNSWSIAYAIRGFSKGKLRGSQELNTEESIPIFYLFVCLFVEARSHYVEQAGFKLRDSPAPISQVLGLKVCHHARLHSILISIATVHTLTVATPWLYFDNTFKGALLLSTFILHKNLNQGQAMCAKPVEDGRDWELQGPIL